MTFRTVKNAIVDLLGSQAESRFIVIGYQKQSKHSDEFVGNNRLVQVYFSDGNFQKNVGRMRGDKTHDINIDIDLSASAMASGDLSVLDSTTATETQKAAALLAVRNAAEVADEKIDELIDYVWNILLDARNENLGLENGVVSSRWIDRIQKDTIIERGDLVVKTANIKYSCRVQETVLGDIGNEPETVIFNTSLPIGDTDGAGVTIENEN